MRFATASWTIRRCSRVIHTDQYRLLSSKPGIRSISTRRDPSSAPHSRTSARMSSRSRANRASKDLRPPVHRRRVNRIWAIRSSGLGSPAPGGERYGSFEAVICTRYGDHPFCRPEYLDLTPAASQRKPKRVVATHFPLPVTIQIRPIAGGIFFGHGGQEGIALQ